MQPLVYLCSTWYYNCVDMKKLFSIPGISEDTGNKIGNLVSELSTSIPGIDEALSFSELMKQVQEMEYDVVVFDTAPTGHTLRLLSFPTMLETSFESLSGIGSSFAPMLSQVRLLLLDRSFIY